MDGNGGEVGDVDLDDLGHPVALGVFLQIEAGSDTERHGGQRRHQHDQQRADPGRQDAACEARREAKFSEEIERQTPKPRMIDVTDEQHDHSNADGQENDAQRLKSVSFCPRDQGADLFSSERLHLQ